MKGYRELVSLAKSHVLCKGSDIDDFFSDISFVDHIAACANQV